MKRTVGAILAALAAVLVFGCAGLGGTRNPPVSGFLSLDEALAEITAAVEARVEQGTGVGVAKVDAPLPVISNFLYEELLDSLSSGGKMVILARGKDVETLNTEHQFQASGLVSDESAVGIGHYLGAKAMIICSFSRFANFSQLSARALDVETGAILATSRPRIRNNDPVLEGVTASLEQQIKAERITEEALDHLNLGKDYYAAGVYDAAIQEFGKALAINKQLSEAYFYRGLAYYDKSDIEKAIADYNAALRIDPNYAGAYNNRGFSYYTKGDTEKAVADWTAALRIDPAFATAYYNRGTAYHKKKDYNRAIADFTAALHIDPNYAGAYNNRGFTYYTKGDTENAIADYNAALGINPNNADALSNRGLAYYQIDEFDRAIADWEAALRINPQHDNALTSRGWWYYNRGDIDMAMMDYNAALRINPNNTSALENRALAYHRKKDYDQAIVDYEALVRLDPSNQLYRENLQFLRSEKAGRR